MAVDKSVIQTAARQALDEMGYSGWVVSAVWQQKSLPAPWQGSAKTAKATALKTWCVDYTNDQGSFPRVYFRCDPNATAEWIKEEIKRQLGDLKKRLAFMDAAHISEPPPVVFDDSPIDRAANAKSAPAVASAPPPPPPEPLPRPVAHQIDLHDQNSPTAGAQVTAVSSAFPPPPPPPSPLLAPANEKDAEFLRAVTAGDEAAVRRSIGGGADVNARMSNGMTPLIHAAFFDRPEIVDVLLSGGADRGARDQLGMTALDWAKSKDNPDVVRLLLNADAFQQQSTARISASPAGAATVAASSNGPAPAGVSNGVHQSSESANTYAAVVAAPSQSAIPRYPVQSEVNSGGAAMPITPANGEMPFAAQIARPSRSFYLRAALLVGALLCLVAYLASLYFGGTSSLSSQSSTTNAVTAQSSTGAATGRSAGVAGTIAGDPTATDGAQQQQPQSSSPSSTATTVDSGGDGVATEFEDSAASDQELAEGSPRDVSPSRTKKAAASGKASAARAARPSPQQERATLRSALAGWVAASDEGDIKKQMTYYAPRVSNYYESRDVTRPEVENEKAKSSERRRQQKRRATALANESEISLNGSGKDAVVRLPRRSSDGRAEVVQELRWQKTPSGWKIVAEREVPTAP